MPIDSLSTILMNWPKTPAQPDLENGPSDTEGGQPTKSDHATQQPNAETTDDDSDGNDKFWTLFQREATSEAQYKVSIWKTELDSLLVFAGLFAAVVSAFLIDLRSRLSPDPHLTRQIDALTEIVSILRNNTTPTNSDSDNPPHSILIAGYLWYGSLVVTLIGALSGVLAQRWLGAFLREIPNNPAEQALERWRRDKAARHWYMGNVITGVPLLTQIALGMFLIGFVFQSLDDNYAIGVEVGTLVGLGFFAYTVLTFLPWLRPDCPFQTPITQLLHLIKENRDTNTDAKIEILTSRLTRSSNDEIFCAAASMLDVKLESDDVKKWYNGIEKRASNFTDALSARLTTFAHQVQTMMVEGSPLTILKNSTGSGANGDTIVGTLSSPVEQGIICLRVLLSALEARISAARDVGSTWVDQTIDDQWKSSKTFPEAWRLLSWSIDITRLVAKNNDYHGKDIVANDWDSIIRKTFFDLTLRSILSISACRGLFRGEQNVKRACALVLAMILEVEATTTPSELLKQFLFDKDFTADKGKDIMNNVWSEMVKTWKHTVNLDLCRTNRFEKIMAHGLYQDEIKSTIPIIIGDLDHENSELQKQTSQTLVKLSKLEPFQQTLKTERVISKLADKLLEESHPDSRPALFAALQAFSKYALYQPDIETSIPIIVGKLDHKNGEYQKQTIEILVMLSELVVFQQILKTKDIITKLITKLEDNHPDVRAASFTALQAFSKYELYQPDIELHIPIIIAKLEHKDQELRKQITQLLMNLSGYKMFEIPLQRAEIIRKLLAKLEDVHSDVRAAAFLALQALIVKYKPYQSDIDSSIPIIIGQLNHEKWELCKHATQILIKLSEIAVFQKTLKTNEITKKLMAVVLASQTSIENLNYRTWKRRNARPLETTSKIVVAGSTLSNNTATFPDIFTRIRRRDGYLDVCDNVVTALKVFNKHKLYLPDSESSMHTIIKQLANDNWELRKQSVGTLIRLSQSDMYWQSLNVEGMIHELVGMLEIDDSEVCTAVAATLKVSCTNNFYHADIASSIPIIIEKLGLKDDRFLAQVIGIFAALSKHDIYQETLKNNDVIPKLMAKLNDGNITIRAAAVQALSVLGTQKCFMEIMKSENAISNLFDKLSDENHSVRSTVREAIRALCENDFYVEELLLVHPIPIFVKQLRDENWKTRQTAVKILSELAINVSFQEAISTEKTVSKLVNMLTSDTDADVRATVVQALSVFGEQEFYREDIKSALPAIMKQLEGQDWTVRKLVIQMLVKLNEHLPYQNVFKDEGFVAKLVAKMEDRDKGVRSEAVQAFSASVGANDLPLEMSKVIPKLVTKLTDGNERVKVSVSDSLLALGKLAGATGFVEAIILTLSTIDMQARKEVYKLLVELAKASSNISAFRAEIDTAICKLLTQLTDKDLTVIRLSITILAETAEEGLTGDGLENPKNMNKSARDTIETIVRTKLVYDKNSSDQGDVALALSRLAKHKIFLACLKPAILGLTEALCNKDGKVWSAAVGAISALSSNADFHPLLVPAVEKVIQQLSVWDYPLNLASNSQNVLIEDLLTLIANFRTYGNLTMNHRIALASALRIASPASTSSEIRVWKLEMAALLMPIQPFTFTDDESHAFCSAVFGNGNSSMRSKLFVLPLPAA